MISTFHGKSAENVWQQAAETFRRGDGVRTQSSRGGPTKENPSCRIFNHGPSPAMGRFQGATIESSIRVGGGGLDHDRQTRSGISGLLEQRV